MKETNIHINFIDVSIFFSRLKTWKLFLVGSIALQGNQTKRKVLLS